MAGLFERIRQTALEFPDRPAHCGGGATMTYRELWARANALVGICGHKEPGMFVVDVTFAAAQLLREALAARIPDHMIPRRVDFLDSFPLPADGKAERKSLGARIA